MKSTPRKMLFAKLAFALAMTVMTLALPARADDDEKPDARLEGYPSQVWLKEGGTGGTMTFLIILMAVTAGVMFMNARRSHLD